PPMCWSTACMHNLICVLCDRSIRCLRNTIHWNFVTTFILRNTMYFLLPLIDVNTQLANEIWCRIVITVFNYFQVTNFFWMFVEGCYLHTVIVMTYSTDKLRKWLFLCLGWGIPVLIITIWALMKQHYENKECWFGENTGTYKYIDYIYQGPIILVLLVNFVFLFNIVRILMTKLRASKTSETIQYRLKAVKATLVLLPLLGITYILYFVNFGRDEASNIIFVFVNSFLMSFQVSVLSPFILFNKSSKAKQN
uniref:G-protein coupled receptors family 2 profile 2 domain-containing protein n=1 Tax=Eptatretus burgeri TaxID=7764 RepID=A0A8C4QN76_EPTBU